MDSLGNISLLEKPKHGLLCSRCTRSSAILPWLGSLLQSGRRSHNEQLPQWAGSCCAWYADWWEMPDNLDPGAAPLLSCAGEVDASAGYQSTANPLHFWTVAHYPRFGLRMQQIYMRTILGCDLLLSFSQQFTSVAIRCCDQCQQDGYRNHQVINAIFFE